MEFFPYSRRPYYYTGERYRGVPYNASDNYRMRAPKKEAGHNVASSERAIQDKAQEDKRPDTRNSDEDAIFEIFGIKLYFDDILIVALIFFLYNEGVQDSFLFIALVLLLLS
ncbi:MAG: hypothetical protein HFJ51_04125 [Clostridia bacterium]|nr:hypothetical protein [Clostridia bacterium]